jgi:hypothetical protein
MSSFVGVGSGPLCAAHAPYANDITSDQISNWRNSLRQYFVPGTTQPSRCMLCLLQCCVFATSAVGLPEHATRASQQQVLPLDSRALLERPSLLAPATSSTSNSYIRQTDMSSGYSTPISRSVSFSGISASSTRSQQVQPFPLRNLNNDDMGSGRALQSIPSPNLSEHSFRFPMPGSGKNSIAVDCNMMLIA